MELIFLTAVHIVPCVAFVARTVLLTHQCDIAVIGHCQGFLANPFPSKGHWAGDRQEVGGGNTASTADANWPKTYSIMCDTVFSNKSWGKGRGCGTIPGHNICLPEQVHTTCTACVLQLCFTGNGWTSAC